MHFWQLVTFITPTLVSLFVHCIFRCSVHCLVSLVLQILFSVGCIHVCIIRIAVTCLRYHVRLGWYWCWLRSFWATWSWVKARVMEDELLNTRYIWYPPSCIRYVGDNVMRLFYFQTLPLKLLRYLYIIRVQVLLERYSSPD